MLLNIVHPYTYKLEGSTLLLGQSPEGEAREREIRVSEFANLALQSGEKVIWHKASRGNPISDMMVSTGFRMDTLYEFLFDENVDSITTTGHGTPIPDNIPEGFDPELWKQGQGIYTSHSQFEEKIGAERDVVFIGGMLENCVANAANYFHQNYRIEDQNLFYIPELCVSVNSQELKEVEKKLRGRNILPLEINSARELLANTIGASN